MANHSELHYVFECNSITGHAKSASATSIAQEDIEKSFSFTKHLPISLLFSMNRSEHIFHTKVSTLRDEKDIPKKERKTLQHFSAVTNSSAECRAKWPQKARYDNSTFIRFNLLTEVLAQAVGKEPGLHFSYETVSL